MLSAIESLRETAEEYRAELIEEATWAKYIEDLAEIASQWIEMQSPDISYSGEEYWPIARANSNIVQYSGYFGGQSQIAIDCTAVTSATSSMMGHSLSHAQFENDTSKLYNQYDQVVRRQNWFAHTETDLNRLNLNNIGGEIRNPVTLLREANTALANPSDASTSPSAVLIPIREAIQEIIAELIRRRPEQKKTRNIQAKVESILRQTHKPEIEEKNIEILSKRASEIVKELSNSKQSNISRQEIRNLLIRSITFMKEFLYAIDETKLKSISNN